MDSYRFIFILFILIIPLVHCIPEGYFYPTPENAFELPNFDSDRTRQNGQVLQRTVSFKVSAEANQPLNIYITDGVIINPNQPFTGQSEETLQNNNPYTNDKISPPTENAVNTYSSPQSSNNQLSQIPSDVLRATSQTTQSAPSIIKHIYFHVPQPDFEENVRPIRSQARKTYRILFIKLPAQSLTNSQAQSINNPSTIEEKTLIYVLVKKPEAKFIVPTSHKLSEHEVVFVKYRENTDLSEIVEIPRRMLSSFKDYSK